MMGNVLLGLEDWELENSHPKSNGVAQSGSPRFPFLNRNCTKNGILLAPNRISERFDSNRTRFPCARLCCCWFETKTEARLDKRIALFFILDSCLTIVICDFLLNEMCMNERRENDCCFRCVKKCCWCGRCFLEQSNDGRWIFSGEDYHWLLRNLVRGRNNANAVWRACLKSKLKFTQDKVRGIRRLNGRNNPGGQSLACWSPPDPASVINASEARFRFGSGECWQCK